MENYRQLNMLVPKMITISDVEYLVEQGFQGECSVVRKHMQTSANLFHASCVFHDVCYTAGGTEVDRARADRGFYRRCILNAASIPSVPKMWYYITVATTWYLAVRLFGWTMFRYGPKRTLDEILQLNKEIKQSSMFNRITRKLHIVWKWIARKVWSRINVKRFLTVSGQISLRGFHKFKSILSTPFWKR